MASRSLEVRIEVDRVDPENRDFRHNDPIGWTEDNRVEILQALYTILLGNPQLKEPEDAAGKTRFKMWWRMVGSAVEFAASQIGHELDFKTLFIEQEADDEESASLADVLEILDKWWPDQKFGARDVDVEDQRSGPEQRRHQDGARVPVSRRHDRLRLLVEIRRQNAEKASGRHRSRRRSHAGAAVDGGPEQQFAHLHCRDPLGEIVPFPALRLYGFD